MKIRNPELNTDYFEAMKQVYFDLAGFPLPKQLQILKQNVPVENMLYGSDGPYTPDFATLALAGALETTDQLTDREKERIFTQNALALLPRLGKILGVEAQQKTERRKRSRLLKRKMMTSVYRILQKRQSHSVHSGGTR